jgi:rubrerythrin
MEKQSLEILIGKAIVREEEAYDFYTSLQAKIKDTTAIDALKFLASEEKKHREFLVAYRDGGYRSNALKMTEVIDYAIAQYIEAPDIQKDFESKDVYLVAAHRELNSYNFYKELAAVQPEGEVRDILLKMANEELKHKEKVEYLYANTAFPQTEGG